MSGRVDIFVSYRHGSRHASWTRDVLVPALEKHGFSVLIDVRDFTPGGILVEEMEAASTRARVTVAIIDETYAHGGFVELERHLARRLIAVFRDQVDDLVAPQAASRVDLIGNDDPSPVIDAVRSLVKRVFILEANEDAEWVAGVVVPTLERTDVSTEHVGGLPAGAIWSDAVTRRLVNADHVVIVLSSAYLRDVHPRADSLVTTVEANEHCHKTLPVRREADLDIPPKFKMQEIIDASRSELWDAALARLCAAVGVELPRPDGPPPCPYPGMRPYSENQSDLFFGREDEIASVLSGLRRHRFVAIIGPSASGKSSLALAGVASSVRERGLGAGRGWEVHTLRPGSDPMGALRAAVEHLRFGPTSSDDQATHPVLLVVDQLEEIFAPDIKDGPAFEAELTRLLDDSRFHVLVTIRADFYPNLMSGSLWSSITRSRVEVVPLSGPRLRAVIRAPARERGVVVAESLVERLAAETEGQPGLQPFLQETLVSLWDGLRHRLLTLEAYERSEARDGDQRSGLQEAIRREAESAVGEIEERCPDGERIVRSILLRLVQFGEGRPHTRRRLPEVALRSAAPDDETFAIVLERLVARRLLTAEGDASGTLWVDLSHEAIIVGWPDLAGWVRDRQAGEAKRRRLLGDAEEWQTRLQDGQPEAGLLDSVELTEAQRWLASPDAAELGIDPVINRYVAASAAQARRRRRRRLMAAATAFLSLIIVVAVLAVTTVVARRAQHDAEQASNQRLALQLRAASADFGDERLPLRALLVHAADQLDPTELSLGEMLATVERERQIAARVDSPGEVGFESTWVDDDVMVAGEGDGHVDVWQMGPSGPDRSSRQTFDVGQTPLAMARERPGGVLAVGVGDGSPDQGAFPGRNGGLYLVDLGEIPMTPRRIPLAGSSPVSALAFSGTMLAVGRWDGTIATIDLQDPAAPRLVQETSIPAAPADSDPRCQQATAMSDRKVRSIAVDETGRWLAAGANNCVLAAWELNALDQPPGVLEGHTDKIRAVAFVPSTSTLLSAGDDRTIRRWDVRQPGPTGTILASQADAQRVISLCVSPDAKTVVTAGRDHHVRRWSLADGLLTPDPTVLTAHADTVRGVVCLSSSRFVSVAGDGLVLWDLARPSRVGRTIALSDGPLGSLALRPGPEREVAAAESDDSQGVGVVRIEGSDGTPRRLQLGSTYPLAVAYSSDGAVLAVAGNQPTQTGGLDGVARLYDASTLATTSSVLVTPGSSMRAIAVRDADDFTAGADDGTIQITADGVTHQTKTQTGFAVSAVAYAPNGQVLVGDVAGAMYCYNPQHPDRPLGRLDLTRAVESIAVGADGTVVAGTADGLVGVFPSAFDPRATITSPCDLGSWTKDNIGTTAAVVSSVALGADGQLLLAGTTDGDVELWDVRRRRLLGRLTLAAGPVPAFAGSDASASTVVVGAGNELDVFALDRSSLRDRLCRAAGRQLFPDELSSFLPVHQDAGRCGSVASS